jgi:subtilisin family serine protease
MGSLKFNMLKRVAIFLSVLILVGGIFSYAMAEEPSVTTSLMVKMVAGLSQDEQAAVIASNGGIETSSIPALRLHVVEVSTSDLSTIIQNYQADPRVVSVEENKTRKAEGIPSDIFYAYQWALPQIDWDMVFGTVIPTGSATVAVLDTGVDSSHTELAGKLVTCTSILDGSDCTIDPNGHGTWMAGIVAAQTNNSAGISGVAYANVNIMPVTVMNAEGIGQDSDIIAGVIWAADHGADVILMGFSNPGFSQNLQDAIDYAWSKGIVLVASTGNDAVNTPTFPAGDRGVIGVSATDSSDSLVSFSNYGQDVFLAAPGIDIETIDIGNSYTSISGTSSSAAIVAGAAAFMRAVEPVLSNGAIVGRLARNADPAGDPANDPDVQLKFGNGRVNMARALADTGLDPIPNP